MIKESKKSPGLTLAINACGSAAELARRLSVERQAVYQWKSIPLGRVVDVEQATGIPREQLRPDLYTREASQ